MSTRPTTTSSRPSSDDSPSIQDQLNNGVSLRDLELPAIPDNEVVQWSEESPLTILTHEALSEYAFRWLNPKARERNNAEGWKYVNGDLATAVKRCGIIKALVGGDSQDGLIRNGDLILGWMPRAWLEKRKEYYEKLNMNIRQTVMNQKVVRGELSKGRHGRFLQPHGNVSVYKGPLKEG